MRIAILREAGGLGDVVMTEPVVRGLHLRHPGAELVYVGLPEYAPLVRNFSAPPDAFLPVERRLRRGRDEAFDPVRHPYLRPVADADLVVDLFCPAFRHERAARDQTSLSRVECFAAAAEVAPSCPSVRVPDEDRAWARGFLAAKGWRGPERGELIALAPWSCGTRRMWPKRNWKELARRLIDAGRTPLVLHALDAPVRDVDGIRATNLSLPEAAAVLTLARLAVTNDSGLLHLATAVGTSTLSLWGSTNPLVTLEGYPRASFLYEPDSGARPAACRAPCYSMREACDYAACRRSCRLLDALAVETVFARIEEELSDTR